jgi:P27 family predicted phage terminase small subunit
MGRPRGNAQDQAALGHPGKRKTKTEKAIAEAERLAKLLALPRATDETSDAPPVYLTSPLMAPAYAIWREYAPRLDKLHLLAQLDRHTFALFCVYSAEFVIANEDVMANGYSTRVKTVSGSYMPRENPSVSRRDFAGKMVLELSGKFGLTPVDRNKLLRDSAMRFDDETLFGRVLPLARDNSADAADVPAEATSGSAPLVAEAGAIGSLDQFDSLPPGSRPN